MLRGGKLRSCLLNLFSFAAVGSARRIPFPVRGMGTYHLDVLLRELREWRHGDAKEFLRRFGDQRGLRVRFLGPLEAKDLSPDAQTVQWRDKLYELMIDAGATEDVVDDLIDDFGDLDVAVHSGVDPDGVERITVFQMPERGQTIGEELGSLRGPFDLEMLTRLKRQVRHSVARLTSRRRARHTLEHGAEVVAQLLLEAHEAMRRLIVHIESRVDEATNTNVVKFICDREEKNLKRLETFLAMYEDKWCKDIQQHVHKGRNTRTPHVVLLIVREGVDLTPKQLRKIKRASAAGAGREEGQSLDVLEDQLLNSEPLQTFSAQRRKTRFET